MKIIYFHGFNSDASGRTAMYLEEKFRDSFISPSYDYINPEKAFSLINYLVENSLKQEKEILLVGTSLGAFWANFFAQKFGLKCILANPSLNPSKSLKKYIGQNVNFQTGEVRTLTPDDCEKYSQFELPINKDIKRITILGTRDETIDYRETTKALDGTHIIFNNEGHRVEDLDAFHKVILSLISR